MRPRAHCPRTHRPHNAPTVSAKSSARAPCVTCVPRPMHLCAHCTTRSGRLCGHGTRPCTPHPRYAQTLSAKPSTPRVTPVPWPMCWPRTPRPRNVSAMQTGYTTATRYTHSTVVYLIWFVVAGAGSSRITRCIFSFPVKNLQGGPVDFLPPDIFVGADVRCSRPMARAFFYCPNLILLQGGPVNFLPPDIFGGRGRGVQRPNGPCIFYSARHFFSPRWRAASRCFLWVRPRVQQWSVHFLSGPIFFFPRAAARLTGGFIFRAPIGCRGPVARGLFLAEIFFLGMAAC